MDGYVAIGTVVKPFGLKGELLVKSLTSFPEERIGIGREYFLIGPEKQEIRKARLSAYRPSGDHFYLAFEGISSPEDAGLLRGFEVSLPVNEAPVPEGYIRLQDLLGLRVLDASSDEELGQVINVLSYAKTPTVKVKGKEKDFTFPLVFGVFVKDISFEKRELRLEVLPGLL